MHSAEEGMLLCILMPGVTFKNISRPVRTHKLEESFREKWNTGTWVLSKGWKRGSHPVDCYQSVWITLSMLMIFQVKI